MPHPFLLALALAAAPPQAPQDSARQDSARQDSAHLVVAATTDVHGHVTGWDYAADRPAPGGLVRVARVLDSLRARYPGEVIALDAGDLLQGDPFAAYYGRVAPRDPHPVVEAMNLAGYDAATPGNHDFDYGVDAMRRALAEAAFPYVSANVHAVPEDTLVYPAWVVLRRGAVRVGVTGFTTPGTMVWNRDQLRGRVRVAPIEADAPRAVAALARESDVRVVVIHSGMDGVSSYDTAGVGRADAAATLAGLPARPDLVIVGHSHREMRDSVLNGVHFVQPPPFARGVSVVHLDLVRRDARWRVVRVRADLVRTDSTAVSARVAARIEPRDRAVRDWAATELGQAAGPMRARASRAQPTPLLDFVNAVQRRRAGADLSAASAFDLGAGWDSGAVRVADLLRLYPFENTLRAVRISGAALKAYLEQSARYFRVDRLGRVALDDAVPGYNFDVVGGARYAIDLRRPAGERIVGLAVRGRPVQPSDSFTMAVNSHRQTGAGGFAMLRGAPVAYDRGEDVRDLLAGEIRARGRLDPADYAEGGWRIVPEEMAAQVRALFGVRSPPPPRAPRDTVLLRVLATADLRGRVELGPWLKATMDGLATECGCPTLRLDAGDATRGTLLADATGGRAVVELMNRLGVGAAAIGTDELDWPADTLRRRFAESRFPWLAANIFDSATGARPAWAEPFRVLESGGLRVAVVGYLTADAERLLSSRRAAGLRFVGGAFGLRGVLDTVRALGPDLTIVLAHAGSACDGPVCRGEAVSLAEGMPRGTVDLILAGHTHQLLEARVASVPILQPGSEAAAVGVADLVRTPAGGRQLRTWLARVNTEGPGDPGLRALVSGYRAQLDSVTRRVVAQIKLPLGRTGDQHRMGALVAEARRNAVRADVGLVGNDEVRADLAAGPATYGSLYAVQPSGSELMRVTLTGSQLRELLERTLAGGRPAAHLAGAVVRYDPRGAAGRRVRGVTLAGGRKLRPGARYTLATDDVDSGSEASVLLATFPREPAGVTDVDALAAYLRRLPQPVDPRWAPAFVAVR